MRGPGECERSNRSERLLHEAYIALGSNLGDRLGNLRSALAHLQADPQIRFDAEHDTASVYETAALGMPNEPDFLNTAVRIETAFSPAELMNRLLLIESKLGRPGRGGSGGWGAGKLRAQSRSIDLDLIFYDDLILEEPGLSVPHPRMTQRLFVLTPLAEIAAGVRHPVDGRSVKELLAELQKSKGSEPAPKPMHDRSWALRIGRLH